MYAAQGVGLAAPQIGVGVRVAVVDVSNGKNPEAKIVCANPQITHAEGEQREEEGCLSLPGFRGYVVRPQYVTVKAFDVTGTEYEMRAAKGCSRARFCHEIDHLMGKTLFIAHLSMLRRDMIRRKIQETPRKEGAIGSRNAGRAAAHRLLRYACLRRSRTESSARSSRTFASRQS